MDVLRKVIANILALVCAAVVGFIATDIVVYIMGIHVGAMRLAPLIRGIIVTAILSMIPPWANFKIRFYVYIAIYLLDLALSVTAATILLFVAQHYFADNPEAMKPWMYMGALIPLVTGAVGYFLLRRSVAS